MSTIRANTFLDSAGGNTATINGITPALATLAEAQAGTDNTKLMTPLRAADAISKLQSMVPLGSLTTTSGTTQTLSGLDLTPYIALVIVAANTSHNGGTNQAMQLGTAQIGTNNRGSTSFFSGLALVTLNNGTSLGLIDEAGATPTPRFGATGYTNATTSISFTWNGGAAFDSGLIEVWGLK